jgi:hypothetical protein
VVLLQWAFRLGQAMLALAKQVVLVMADLVMASLEQED